MKTLSVCKAQEIRARIMRRMDLWERGLHADLVRDAEAEGAARGVRSDYGSEEEDDAEARSYHDMVLSDKIRQAIRQATDMEGGGCLLPDDPCTKTGRPVAEVLREKHPDMHVPLWRTPHEQPSRSMGKYPKQYLLTPRRMT